MKAKCPSDDELLLFVNGEQTQNRTEALRCHVNSCSRCRSLVQQWKQIHAGIAAELPSINPQLATESVMRRIRAGEQEARPHSWIRSWQFLAGTLAVTAVLAVLVLRVVDEAKPAPQDNGTFRSRSGQSRPVLARKVGVRFYVMRDRVLTKVTQNNKLLANDKLTLSYVNAVAGREVYLLAFAVDARGELHWVYPEYTTPNTNPPAIELRTGEVEVVMPDLVQLDRPALGVMRLVSIVTFDRLTVSDVEKLARPERTLAIIKRRWPNAEVGETPVLVDR